jgi:hypothetical protein
MTLSVTKKIMFFLGACVLVALTSLVTFFVVKPAESDHLTMLAPVNIVNTSTQLTDLSFQELVALNKKLTEKVRSLQQQIAYLTTEKIPPKNQQLQTRSQISQSEKSPNIPFLSPKFIKKSIPPINYIISQKLKKILELSPDQETALAKLLKQKAETDIDLFTPILNTLAQGSVEQLFHYAEEGFIDDDLVAQQVALDQQNNQDYFEATLQTILTETQINAYYEFEVDKASTAFQANIRHKKRLLKNIPNLETYQLDEITRFLDEQTLDLSTIKIAASQNPISQSKRVVNYHFKKTLDQQLNGLLTPEQLSYYNENIKMVF